MKKLVVFLIIAVLAVSMSFIGIGCKTTAAETEETEEVAAETAEAEVAEIEEAEAEETEAEEAEPSVTDTVAGVEYKICYFWPNAHPFWGNVEISIDKFIEEYGIDVYKQVGTDWTQETENQFIEGLVAQGYNAFALPGMDATGANALYQELVDKGIPVINTANTMKEPTPISFNIATDVKAAAMIATEAVIKGMGEKGGLLDILETVQDPNTVLRQEGVEEVVAKYPDVKVVQTIGNMDTIDVAVQKISDALATLGDQVNGMVTTGYNPTVAAAQILTERKNSTISYVGIDDDPIVLKAIEDGYMIGTFAQSPYKMGYLACHLLKLILEGHEVKDAPVFIDSSGLIITKDNISTYKDGLWEATYEARDSALETWFTK